MPTRRASLGHALSSPRALFRMPARAWLWFFVYLALAGALLLATAWQLSVHRGRIESWLLSYLFPDSWHLSASKLVEVFFAAQHRIVLINASVTASLMVVSLFLFPVKEMLSAAFEADARLVGEPVREHPLWEQGWQEVKFFALILALQGTIFWLGFLPHAGLKLLAMVLGYLLVFFAFAVDFISPLFQRHEGHYSRVFKTLLARPGASLAFGVVFSLPTMIVGKVWDVSPDWSWNTALFVLFGVNVLCIAWAAASGTWLASQLYPIFARTRRSAGFTRLVASVAVLALVLANIYAYGALTLAIHHKSQILKCHYDVEWTTFDIDRPSLTGLLANRIDLGASIDIRIANPTRFDVAIEDNEIIVRHQSQPVATTRIAPMAIPAGQTVTQKLAFSVVIQPSLIARGLDLLDRDAWQLTLYIDVAPYVRVPFVLLGKDR